jgi:hypothetical protein
MSIEIEFSDGLVGARAQGLLEPGESAADKPVGEPAKPRARSARGSGQGDLF